MELPLTGAESVDAIIKTYPAASLWLYRRDIICVLNGAAFSGTLDELIRRHAIDGAGVENLVDGLNGFLQSQPVVRGQTRTGPM